MILAYVNQIFVIFLLWNIYCLFFIFVLVKKKINQLYFINICLILRAKYFLWCIWIDIRLLRYFITSFCFFLFLKFCLDYTEKISKLIIFFLEIEGVDSGKIFIEVLMGKLHHLILFFSFYHFLFLLFFFFKIKILKNFALTLLWFDKGIWHFDCILFFSFFN